MSVSVIPREVQQTREGKTGRDHNIFNQQFRLERGLRRGDGSEPFLPCSVPDLEFNSFSINLYCADLEVNSNSSYVTACEECKSTVLYIES